MNQVLLNRAGSKSWLIRFLIPYFPEYKMLILPFFGAGGDWFTMPKPNYTIANDLDDDVFNLYFVVEHHSEELIKAIESMPLSESLLKYWMRNVPKNKVKKAVRFLFLSNCTYLGKGNQLRFGIGNEKEVMLAKIEPTRKWLGDRIRFMNTDFRNVFDNISFTKKLCSKDEAFAYLDPVFAGTTKMYKVPKWKWKDTEDCFKLMAECGVKCALSEFYSARIRDLAKDHNFHVIPIKGKRNIKGKKMNVLVTNYTPNGVLFDPDID